MREREREKEKERQKLFISKLDSVYRKTSKK